MKMHANARLSLKGRELLVDRVGERGVVAERRPPRRPGSVTAPRASGSPAIAPTGVEGLLDRCSAPAVVANRTDERRVEVIAALRRLRMTGAEIAENHWIWRSRPCRGS